jgi:hypothetical protein
MGRLGRDISIRMAVLVTPTYWTRMSRKESRGNVFTRPASRPYNPPGGYPALVSYLTRLTPHYRVSYSSPFNSSFYPPPKYRPSTATFACQIPRRRMSLNMAGAGTTSTRDMGTTITTSKERSIVMPGLITRK